MRYDILFVLPVTMPANGSSFFLLCNLEEKHLSSWCYALASDHFGLYNALVLSFVLQREPLMTPANVIFKVRLKKTKTDEQILITLFIGNKD